MQQRVNLVPLKEAWLPVVAEIAALSFPDPWSEICSDRRWTAAITGSGARWTEKPSAAMLWCRIRGMR